LEPASHATGCRTASALVKRSGRTGKSDEARSSPARSLSAGHSRRRTRGVNDRCIDVGRSIGNRKTETRAQEIKRDLAQEIIYAESVTAKEERNSDDT